MIQRMQKGYNSDVSWEGESFHVQTEDWGVNNPYIVSRVYQSGAVLKSIKTAYVDVLASGPTTSAQAIRLAMREQHQQILDQLLSGQLF